MIIFDGDYTEKLKQAIDEATGEIRVAMYVWRWYVNRPTSDLQQVYSALLRAQARGVKIRIVTDFPEVAARMRADGLDAIETDKSRIMHAKMFIIDASVVFVGSHNMTHRSTTQNHEATVKLTDFESIAQAVEYFDIMWKSYA